MSHSKEHDNLKKNAHKMCQNFLLGTWKTLSLEDFQFDAIKGGLSNKLYRCALPEESNKNDNDDRNMIPNEVLLRIYGPVQGEQNSIFREITIFALLSERGLGPKLHGLFSEGRLEEYIPSRSLDWNDACTLSTSIAIELAKFHALQLPISKKPIFEVQAYNWLESLEMHVERNSTNSADDVSISEMRKEVQWIMNQIDKTNSPVVFCHNDLHKGNILLMNTPKKDGQTIMLIDYEMAHYNYREFDLANYFNELCIEYKTEMLPHSYEVHIQNYPTKSEQVRFLTAYLRQLQKEKIDIQQDFQTELDKLLKNIPIFKLATHLYWAIACFRFDHMTSLNFPFWEYAHTRLEMYKQHKKEFLMQECHISAQ